MYSQMRGMQKPVLYTSQANRQSGPINFGFCTRAYYKWMPLYDMLCLFPSLDIYLKCNN